MEDSSRGVKRVRSCSESESIEKVPRFISAHGGKHLSIRAKEALVSTARALATKGKGITACDESAGTIGKRFDAVGVENTEENRRIYREMLFKAPNLNKLLSGAILDPETLLQKDSDGAFFPFVLHGTNIIPGVKPHLKVYELPGTEGDTVMQGLDSLAPRCKAYYEQGARFTKWRSPLEIDMDKARPTRLAIESNMRDLARFALISQSEGLVPLVEPDVIMKGTHGLDAAIAINTEIASCLYREMLLAGVFMEGCILKTNMVCPGLSCPTAYTVREIAEANLTVLKRTMPAAIPGVNFLSGGQSLNDAAGRLNAINTLKDSPAFAGTCPWNLSFSWSAAIQMPLFDLCKTKGGLKEALADMEALYLAELGTASKASVGKLSGGAWEHAGAHSPQQ
jgi:fructose-bisphosphate aldolase class I